jgi:monoamine oxidase
MNGSTHDVLVVGGGLSGLTSAWLLHARGVDVRVCEARRAVGGRTRTVWHDGVPGDLGAAWYWPHQLRIAALAETLGVDTVPQVEDGQALFDAPAGVTRFPSPGASGARRFRDGAQALCARLADALSDRVRCGAPVVRIARGDDARASPLLAVTLADGTIHHAHHVVLALPPRVIAHTITFAPSLPPALHTALERTPTWMGGAAKAVVTFATPFWRARGLSGFAVSHVGPLGELHDHSPPDGRSGALMGFFAHPDAFHAPAETRRAEVIAQLVRLFGAEAASCLAYHDCAWWQRETSSAPRDREPLLAHPAYGDPALARGWWDDTLWFAGSETAAWQGGYLEGAVDAAARVTGAIVSRHR